jgi:hypothetical protein
VEEIGGQERAGAGAQEHAPGSAVPRRRWDAVSARDLADGGGGRPVAEPANSPWILAAPRRMFCRASRRMSATGSSGTGGRPGGLDCRHLAATSRWCQRSSVPGGAIRWACSASGVIFVKAAGTARPVRDTRGLGFARRSTATSCRSAYRHVPGRPGPGRQREPGQHGHQQPASQRDRPGR